MTNTEQGTHSTESVDQALARESGEVQLSGRVHVLTITMLASWSLFQLYLSSGLGPMLASQTGFGIVNDIYARAAHVAFGTSLCFLLFTGGKRAVGLRKIPWYDYVLAAIIILACFWQATYFSEIIGTTGATRPIAFSRINRDSSVASSRISDARRVRTP